MSYGFSAVNDSGLIQIDELFTNYQIYQSGSAVHGTVLSYPINGIVLIAPTAYTTVVCMTATYTRSGATESCTFYGASNWGTDPGYVCVAAAITVYYIVVLPSDELSVASGNYGLNVYDSSGAISFSSNNRTPSFQSVTLVPVGGGYLSSVTLAGRRSYISVVGASYTIVVSNGCTSYSFLRKYAIIFQSADYYRISWADFGRGAGGARVSNLGSLPAQQMFICDIPTTSV